LRRRVETNVALDGRRRRTRPALDLAVALVGAGIDAVDVDLDLEAAVSGLAGFEIGLVAKR